MTQTQDGLDDLAEAYIGLWRDYVAQLSQAHANAVSADDAAAMVNAGAEAWQKALSAYGHALTSAPLGPSEPASDGTAAAEFASDDGNDVVRQLHERISALEQRLNALEGNS